MVRFAANTVVVDDSDEEFIRTPCGTIPRGGMAGSGTNSCSACGYSPVAVDARSCPRCGASNPNPGRINRFVGRGMLFGLGVGSVVGAGAGWFSGQPGMAFGGALLGAIPGLFVGMILGLVMAVVSAVSGRSSGEDKQAGTANEQNLPENV